MLCGPSAPFLSPSGLRILRPVGAPVDEPGHNRPGETSLAALGRAARDPTRPAARITRDLQAEGLVSQGVEPALTPLYIGVKAAAFRIPAEMVTILEDGGEPVDEEPEES